MAKSYDKIAADILAAVGGKDNIVSAMHCATRLRLRLKDESIVSLDEIKAIDGVVGAQYMAGQLQIIIGAYVEKAYKEFCKQAGIEQVAAIDENLDGPKEKLTVKKALNNALKYASGSMIQLMPAMIAASLIRVVKMFLCPGMLGWIAADSDFAVLADIVYNAFFNFMPIFVGIAAAKQLKVNMFMGGLMGAILVLPAFTALAGTDFTVYGIPCNVTNYASSVLPALLCVWVMSYVERLLKKVIPETLAFTFNPLLTLLVMLPVGLCLLAPIGTYAGELISRGIEALRDLTGAFGLAVLCGLWQFLVMTGMHATLTSLAFANFLQTGVDSFFMIVGPTARWAMIGIAVGALLRMKGKKNRATNIGMVLSTLFGPTEPVLFGICMPYRKPFIALFCGGFVGGLYAGLTHTVINSLGGSGMFTMLAFAGGDKVKTINGVIACLLSFAVAALITFFFGFNKKEAEAKELETVAVM